MNLMRYKLVLRTFATLTSNSLELLHARLNNERLEEEIEFVSSEFKSFKSSKDALYAELSKARKEEMQCLTKDNHDLQTKINELEETIRQNRRDEQSWLERIDVLEETIDDNNSNEEDWKEKINTLEESISENRIKEESWTEKINTLEESISKNKIDEECWKERMSTLEETIKENTKNEEHLKKKNDTIWEEEKEELSSRSHDLEIENKRLLTEFQNFKISTELSSNQLEKTRRQEKDNLSKEMSEEISRLQRENNELLSRIREYTTTIKEQSNEILTVHDKMTSVEGELKELRVQIRDCEKRSEDEKKEVQESTNKEKENEINYMKVKVASMEAEIECLQSKLMVYEKKDQENKNEMQKLQKEHQESMDRACESTTSTTIEKDNEIRNLSIKIQSMEGEMEELQSKIKEYERTVDDKKDKIIKLQESLTQVNDSSTLLSKEKEQLVRNLNLKMSSIECEVSELQSKIKMLEKKEMSKKREIKRLRQEHQVSASTTLEKEVEIKNLNMKINNMEGEMDELQAKVKEYQKKITNKKNEIIKLQKDHQQSLSQFVKSNTSLSKQKEEAVRTLNHKMVCIEGEVAEMQSKIRILEKKIEEKKSEIAKLQRQHRQSTPRVLNATTMADQENEIRNLNQQTVKLESENEQLRQRIKLLERKEVDKENEFIQVTKGHTEALKKERDSAESAALQSKENEIRILKMKLATLEDQNEELLCNVKYFDKRDDDRKEEIKKLQQQYDERESEVTQSTAVENELKTTKLKVTKFESENKELQSRIKMFRETEEDAAREILLLTKEYDESVTQVEVTASKIIENEKEIDGLNTKVTEMQVDNKQLQTQICAFEKSDEDKKEEIVYLLKQYNDSLLEVRESAAVAMQQEEQLQKMSAKVTKLELKNEELRTKIEILEGKEGENKIELTKLCKERMESLKQIRDGALTAKEREGKVKSMNIKIANIQTENEELRAKITDFEKREEENRHTISKLQKEYDESLKEMHDSTKVDKDAESKLKGKIAKLEEEKEELRSKIKIFQNKLEHGNDESVRTERVHETTSTTSYREVVSTTKDSTKSDSEIVINEMNIKLTKLEMENHELKAKIKVFQEIIEEDKKNEIAQNQKILQVQTAHHSIMEEKQDILKKMDPALSEIKLEYDDLRIKVEAYKVIVDQKDSKIKDMEEKLKKKADLVVSNSETKNETLQLQSENEKLLSQMSSYKVAVQAHRKANEEAHEEVTKLTLENSNLMSQFDCFLSAINRKEKLCKKLASKVCDLEAINEKLFYSVSQSVTDREDGDCSSDFFYSTDDGKYNEGMKDLLADTIIEQEERLVAEITTENVYENKLQRSERISINTSRYTSRRGSSDSLMNSVYSTLKTAEKAQLSLKDKLSLVEHDRSQLDNKCRYLEGSIEKLRKEKLEYLNLILELTQYSPEEGKQEGNTRCNSNNNIDAISKIRHVDNGCQTDEMTSKKNAENSNNNNNNNNKSKHSLKVAHIKPLISEENNNSTGSDRDLPEHPKEGSVTNGRDEHYHHLEPRELIRSPYSPRKNSNSQNDYNDTLRHFSSNNKSKRSNSLRSHPNPSRYTFISSKEALQEKENRRNSKVVARSQSLTYARDNERNNANEYADSNRKRHSKVIFVNGGNSSSSHPTSSDDNEPPHSSDQRQSPLATEHSDNNEKKNTKLSHDYSDNNEKKSAKISNEYSDNEKKLNSNSAHPEETNHVSSDDKAIESDKATTTPCTDNPNVSPNKNSEGKTNNGVPTDGLSRRPSYSLVSPRSRYPYSSHYNSIIHKYDKFVLPSRR